MRQLHSSACVVFSIVIAWATISERDAAAQLQYTVSAGPWVSFLPEYRAGFLGADVPPALATQGAFSDDQIGVGAQLTLLGTYHFSPTRTIIENDLQIAGYGSLRSRSRSDDPGVGAAVWMPDLDGLNPVGTADGESAAHNFDSSVFFLSKFIGLRDRFSLRSIGLGDLDIGCGFSYMMFDQDMRMTSRFSGGLTQSYRDDLDTIYLGGQFRGTLNKQLFGRNFIMEARYGIYQMDADYNGKSSQHNAGGALVSSSRRLASVKQMTSTVDLSLKTDTSFWGVHCRPSIGVQYFDDMPSIVHPRGIGVGGTTLSTESAYVINANLEFVY